MVSFHLASDSKLWLSGSQCASEMNHVWGNDLHPHRVTEAWVCVCVCVCVWWCLPSPGRINVCLAKQMRGSCPSRHTHTHTPRYMCVNTDLPQFVTDRTNTCSQCLQVFVLSDELKAFFMLKNKPAELCVSGRETWFFVNYYRHTCRVHTIHMHKISVPHDIK